ncbi:hypothetical protein CDD82_7138 [Ophiocordyceps australis]|uniref:Uncharacterized protein n=1 Tax=Ophiocordyceps australis TaxID=1399860 RepID=A0A2C5ZLW6_9HYPO|nr:hypothetical protein CDD82_7138 [Ophiocordyceps australis]
MMKVVCKACYEELRVSDSAVACPGRRSSGRRSSGIGEGTCAWERHERAREIERDGGGGAGKESEALFEERNGSQVKHKWSRTWTTGAAVHGEDMHVARRAGRALVPAAYLHCRVEFLWVVRDPGPWRDAGRAKPGRRRQAGGAAV